MKSVAECLGENLKRLRQERELTQESFAKRAKISQSFLQSIEGGHRWVGPKTIQALAKALKVSESELFHDCDALPAPDAKEILLVICRAFGYSIDPASLQSLKLRTPSPAQLRLIETMPYEICEELAKLSRQPSWDWDKFRRRLRA